MSHVRIGIMNSATFCSGLIEQLGENEENNGLINIVFALYSWMIHGFRRYYLLTLLFVLLYKSRG